MTIEEAIVKLERLKKCEVYLWSEDKQAIDMAVKALEENDALKTEIMAVKSGSCYKLDINRVITGDDNPNYWRDGENNG